MSLYLFILLAAAVAQAGLCALAMKKGQWHYMLGLFGGGCAFVQLALLEASR